MIRLGRPGPVVVGSVDSHSRARDAGFAEGNSRGQRYVGESSIAFIAVELIRLSVVGDEQVHPAIAVEVQQRHAERFRSRIMQPGSFRYVLKRTIASVPYKDQL